MTESITAWTRADDEAEALVKLKRAGTFCIDRIGELARFTDLAASIMVDQSLMFSLIPSDIRKLIIVQMSAVQPNMTISMMYGTFSIPTLDELSRLLGIKID